MKIKTYTTLPSDEVYEQYKKAEDKEIIINDFIGYEKANSVTSREDFFSLLLSEAIQHNDLELVKEILEKDISKDNYPLVLTNVDELQMGPLAYALLLDKGGEIKVYFKELLNHGYRFNKVELTKDALLKMLDIIECQGEKYIDCINDFLKPIIVEEEVTALGEAIYTGVISIE